MGFILTYWGIKAKLEKLQRLGEVDIPFLILAQVDTKDYMDCHVGEKGQDFQMGRKV